MDAKYTQLEHVISDFLTAKEAEGKSPDTLIFYGQNLARIRWWLETNGFGEDIGEVTTGALRSLLVYVKTAVNRWKVGSTSSRKPASKSTVDAYWRTLQAFFSWVVREEIIDATANPMKRIPRPKVPHKIIQDIPLPMIKKVTELPRRSRFLEVRNKAIILTFLDTGVRLGGLTSMKMANTNPETGLAFDY